MILETIEAIEARLIATLQANPALYDPGNPDPAKRGLTSTSQVSAWKNFLNTVATEIFTLQQLMGAFETEDEAIIALAAPAIAAWLKNQVLLFQYDAITPQIANLVDFVATYPVVDASKRIITQCSIITDGNKNVSVKVAKGSPPQKLAAGELSDLQSFLDIIEPAGIQTTAISLDPDRLFLDAQIFYDGQYTPIIQATAIAGINAFLSAIPFDGVMKLSALEEAILAIPGVKDVVFNNVRTRDSGTPLGSAQYLVQAETQISRQWQTVAGYIIQEDTAANTFADTLIFTVE